MYAKITFYDDYTREEILNTSIYGRVYGNVTTTSYDYGEDDDEEERHERMVELTVEDER